MRRALGPCKLLLALLVSIDAAAGSVEGPLKYNIFPSRRQSCEVEVLEFPVPQAQCLAGGNQEATLSLNLRNTGDEAVPVPYTVAVRNPEYQGASNPFNLALSSPDARNGWISGIVSSQWQTLQAGGMSQASLGFSVQAASNDTFPSRVTLNGIPCTLLVKEPAGVDEVVEQHLTTKDGEIIGVDGEPVDLKGIAWFGFDDGNTLFDGLWKPEGGTKYPSSLRMELTTVLQRIQLLGFNAIRVPFSFKDLYTLGPRNFTANCTHVTEAQLLNSVTPPDLSIIPDNATLPEVQLDLIGLPDPIYSPDGMCNTYVPGTSTLERFVWTVDYLTKQGFYVVLVNQFNSDSIFVESPPQWLLSWQWLMQALQKGAPAAFPRLIIDPVNEPEIQSIFWEDDLVLKRPGLTTMYLQVLDMLYDMEPKLLFFLQGTGQAKANLVTSAGDGFVTDPAILAARENASDPNPFFRELLKKPYLEQTVITPHTYPPSISGSELWQNFTADAMWRRFSDSFGYFNTGPGYCDTLSGRCHRFPVVLGEFGSKFESLADIEAMYDIAEYLHNTGDAEDGRHSRIGSWFFWAYNANSGDTGGLVDDNWEEVLWDKIEYLQYCGLRPWYMNSPEFPAIVEGENDTLAEDVGVDPPRPDFKLVAPPDCTDKAPDNLYTCAEQKSFGKCEAGFIVSGNYCKATCGRCAENGTVVTNFHPSPPATMVAAPAPSNDSVAAPSPAASPEAPAPSLAPLASEAPGVPSPSESAGPASAPVPDMEGAASPDAEAPSAVEGCTLAVFPGLVFETETGALQVPLSLQINVTGGRLTPPWRFGITNPHYAGVVQSFGWQIRAAAPGNVSGVVVGQSQILDGSSGHGATLAAIMQVTSATDLAPHAALLNNQTACKVAQPLCSLQSPGASPSLAAGPLLSISG